MSKLQNKLIIIEMMKLFRKTKFFLSTDQIKFPTIHNYQISGYLGKGSSSRVFQGVHLPSKKQVIVKLFKDTVPQAKIKKQIRINQVIQQCSNIVPFRDVIRDDDGSYGIIFRNCQGVTLNHLIGHMQEHKVLEYMKQIMIALNDIHSLGIVHCDLKPSNILITEDGAKLFDFGLSRQVGIEEFKIRRFGTKCYYTPQVMFRYPSFNRKVDIWVMGLIFAQMMCKMKPLMPYQSDQQTQKQIVKFCGFNKEIVNVPKLSKLQPISWNIYYDSQNKLALELIKKMMRIHPNERPEASEILEDPLFEQVYV